MKGVRQAGKTWILQNLMLASGQKILLEKTLIIFDEIQKAPELFEQIKIMCDETEERGLFWLTGSWQYKMMKNIRDTLAGRIGILELYSLSKNEVDGKIFTNKLDFSLPCLLERQKAAKKNDIVDVFEHIWRGGMPDALSADGEQRQEYFNSYIETYLMRDVAEEGGITDSVRFRKFLNACAALTAEQVNYKTLAETAEISQPTAKVWLRILQGSGIVYLLPPFANNELKRLTKTPKLYFCDTGLCAYLSMWLTRDTLMNGAANACGFQLYFSVLLWYNTKGFKAFIKGRGQRGASGFFTKKGRAEMRRL